MADTADIHPTAGRRRKEKGPPSGLALPRLERVSDIECGHSDDSAGEKEAKRQRSNPGTPVSTPRRMPYDYDAVMGITRVGTREAEGFDEDLGSLEYHDANETTEDPTRKDETECTSPQQRSTGFQGGYGSSSLKECIELLNTTTKIAPAPLDSGVGKKSPDPLQVMSPNVEESLTDARAQPSSGSISQEAVPMTQTIDGSDSQKVSQVKDEPLSQVKDEPVKEIKPESSSSTQEVKVEQDESETNRESAASVKPEEHAPEPDSEDSFTPERAVEAIQRLLEAQESRTGEREHLEEEGEVRSPHVNPRERVSGSETSRGLDLNGLRSDFVEEKQPFGLAIGTMVRILQVHRTLFRQKRFNFHCMLCFSHHLSTLMPSLLMKRRKWNSWQLSIFSQCLRIILQQRVRRLRRSKNAFAKRKSMSKPSKSKRKMKKIKMTTTGSNTGSSCFEPVF